MRAEYIIGLEILCFVLGFLIGDLKNLGAATPRKRRSAPSQARRAAPSYQRKPW